MASSKTPVFPPSHRKPLLRNILIASLGVLFVSMGMVTVYFRSFTGFSDWDDEGYVMIGLRSFLQGNALYDHVQSQYGPFYYLVEAGLYTVLHIPVTHNAVRALMGFFWLLTALLTSWSIHRLTRSWILTALGLVAAIKLLQFFLGSPGHPEEVCIALLIGVLLCACYLSDRATVWTACLMGSLIAALALTKINIGVYAALGIGLALLKAMSPGPKQKIGFALLSLAGLSLPVIILRPILYHAWAQRAAIFVVLSLSAALLAVWFSETERRATSRVWVAFVAASAVVAALIVAAFLARGTTLSAMLSLSVLQHKDGAKEWWVPLPVRTEWVAILSLVLAVVWVRMSATSKARGPMIIALTVLKLSVSGLWCFALQKYQWPFMYNLTIPFVWLALVPPTVDGARKQPFARVALCSLSALSALYPLPVAGAQGPFSLVLTIPIVCIFLDDARVMLVTTMPLETVIRLVRVAAVVLIVTMQAFWARDAVQTYRRLAPLALPGAERIHLRARNAADYQWIVARLHDSCDSYFSMPGILSLYFWTNTTPPTRQLMSNWIGLLNQEQQQQIVNDLSGIHRLCIVYNPHLVEFWRRGQDLSASPLARYIEDGFVASEHRRDYTILVRRDPIQR